MRSADIIGNDTCKCFTGFKNSFTCCTDKKGEHWLLYDILGYAIIEMKAY